MPQTAIFVLPSSPNSPPRAILAEVEEGHEEDEEFDGVMAIWSRDFGCWCVGGVPLQPELSEAITAHAKSLGVEW